MGAYDRALATSDRLIKAKGGLVSVSRPTPGYGPYDPTKPWKPDSTAEDDTVLATGLHAVLLSEVLLRGEASFRQALAPSATAVFYLSPLEVSAVGVDAFKVGDIVTDARGVAYMVVEYEPYEPGDVLVLDTLHVRSA